MRQHRTVLAIDGGGIRGIIPAMVIDYLERELGRPASELFDLIAGTSTGGIIGLGLGLPEPHNPHRPRYCASELADLYAHRGADIFSRSLWRRVRSLRGVLDETYDHRPLEQTLSDYFAGSRMGSLRCHVMVSAYDIEHRRTVFLKSFKPEHYDVKCVDAARATSAAPTYFEPAEVPVDGIDRALIDGGVFVNSPAVSAYAEAMKLFPGDDITVVSLGTGELIRKIPREKASGWGSAGWVLPLLDCMFDGVSKVTDHQMRLFLGERYQRFQLSLDVASDDMDDATEENIQALFATAEQLIDTERERLDALMDHLDSVHTGRQPRHLHFQPAVF